MSDNQAARGRPDAEQATANAASHQRALAAGLIAGLAGLVIGGWVAGLVSGILVGLAGGALAVVVVRHLASGGRARAGAARAVPEVVTAPWIASLRRLLRVNLEVREAGLDREVVAKLEEIIDELRELIPGLCEDHKGSELTWTVTRMAEDYLPRVLGPFLALSPGERAQHQGELVKSLSGLEAELDGIRALVREAKVGEFQAKAAFLRARFLDASAR